MTPTQNEIELEEIEAELAIPDPSYFTDYWRGVAARLCKALRAAWTERGRLLELVRDKDGHDAAVFQEGRAAEREECAKLVEEFPVPAWGQLACAPKREAGALLQRAADAIRARGAE